MMDELKKQPPLGLMPHKIWLEARMWDIYGAMGRYMENRKPIPVEWIKEFNQIRDELGRETK
jgi:hypothetical protein